MNTPATVISLVGQAWALAADGTRRELQAGDRLRGDEMLISGPGARVDLDFGDDQVLTFLGEQSTPIQTAVSASSAPPALSPQARMVDSDEQPLRVAPQNEIVPEGHNFVQLVRIAEIIEADGITPVTVARIQEILRPLGMSLPDREFDRDHRYEHRGEDNGNRGLPSVTVPVGTTTSSTVSIPENAETPVTGTFIVRAPNGLQSISVGGTTVSNGDLLALDPNDPSTHIVIPGAEGNLTLTDYDPNTGTVTYTYQQEGSSKDHSAGEDSVTDTFPIIVTDQRNLTSPPGNVVVLITDTAPEAVDDSAEVDEDAPPITGNVITGDDGGAGEDTLSADPTEVTGVVPGNVPPGTHVPDGNISTTVTGTYGELTLNPDGSYTYTLNNDNAEVNALKDGETLEEVFTYTLTDSDGDQSTATLTITINGKTDGPPTIVPEDVNDDEALPPVATIGHATVYEAGLADDDGSEKTSGTITVTTPDGLDSLIVGGTPVSLQKLRELDPNDPETHVIINTPYGVLTLTEFTSTTEVGGVPTEGELHYDYVLTTPYDNDDPSEAENGLDQIPLTVTDAGGEEATGNLVINIIDDAPMAVDDVNSVDEDAAAPVTGNVIGGTDASDGDEEDRVGADGATVTAVTSDNVTGNVAAEDEGVLTIVGEFGTLTINPDGSYSYALDNDNAAVNALKDDDTLEEVFTYTLTDGDGDADTAKLTITINGKTDGPPSIVPEDVNGEEDPSTVATIGHATVHEAGLADDDGSEKTSGTITVTTPDGLGSLTVGGTVVSLQELRGLDPTDPDTHITIVTPYGELTLTEFTPTTEVGGVPTEGELHYDYVLKTPYDNDEPSEAENGLDQIPLTVTDAGGEQATGNLVINIIDDAPMAVDDVNSVDEDAAAPVTGNVIGGTDASDGDAEDRVGADGATVTAVTSDNVTGNVATEDEGVLTIVGEFGTLTINPDGSYSYALNNDNAEVNALKDGETLEEVFTYTLTDSDGDADSATLTITINGKTDGPPTIVPEDVNGDDPSDFTTVGQVTVHERGLTGADSSHTSDGSITITAPDGLASIEVGGRVITLAELEALDASTPIEIDTPQGKLILTGFDVTDSVGGVPTLGELQFTYELEEVQNTPADPLDPDVGRSNSEEIELKVIDAGGEEATGNLVINIIDDAPTAVDDVNSVDENAAAPVTGNVIGGTDASDGDAEDRVGADGATVTAVTSDNATDNTASEDGDGVLTIVGEFGTLTINPDGSYSYALDNDNPAVNALKDDDTLEEVFTYTLTDGDGDADTAKLTITINGKTDGPPTIVPEDVNGDDPTDFTTIGQVTVYERGLVDTDNSHISDGSITITAPDGLASIEVGGRAITLAELEALAPSTPIEIDTPAGKLILTGFEVTDSVGGVPTLGELKFTYELEEVQNTPADPLDPEVGLSNSEEIDLKVIDAGGEEATGLLVVTIVDDVPVITPGTATPGSVTVDESDFVNGSVSVSNPTFVENVFAFDYGADGSAATDALTYSLSVSSDGVASGVTDTATGQLVYLYQDGNSIVGLVGSAGVEDPDGEEAFRIEIDGETGEVTLTQSRPLQHPDTGNHDDSVSLSPTAITLAVTAVDGDGDITRSDAISVGDRFIFKDDGPSIDQAPVSSTVNEANLVNGTNPDVPETSRTQPLNVNFGGDGAGDVRFTDAATNSTTASLEALGLQSGGDDLSYAVSADGHTLTAYRGGDPDDASQHVFTVEIVDPTTAPAYRFTLIRSLDHVDEAGDAIAELGIEFEHIRVTDADGDHVETEFTVTVIDDVPDPLQPKEITVGEDSDSEAPANTFFANADATEDNTDIVDQPQFGTAVVNQDGTITYTPNPNYSGADSFTYSTTVNGQTKTFNVDVTVTPVADTPNLPHADSTDDSPASITLQTPEDTAIALGLKLPVITDNTQATDATTEDYPERLGAISLSDLPEGAKLFNGDPDAGGVELTPAADGSFTFIIIDVPDYHIDGVPAADASQGIYHLTKEDYEDLFVLPAADDHNNFDLTLDVTSYEVDGDGVPLPGVGGAPNSQVITVDVLAVTDEVTLTVQNGSAQPDVSVVVDPSGKSATVTFNEDAPFNLTNILSTSIQDTDGSEERRLILDGLPDGTIITVNGTEYVLGGTSSLPTVDASDSTYGGLPYISVPQEGLPTITIQAPEDFSGDIEDVTVTLWALDSDDDSDSAQPGEANAPVVEADAITLNLRVNPVAGDVEVEGVTTAEDTEVAFLSGIAITDESTGSDIGVVGEIITAVSFSVPTGWTVSADGTSWTHATLGTWTVNVPAETADWSLSVDVATGTYSISADTAGFDLKPVLDAFTATPPAHSSRDLTLQDVTVTSQDSNTVGGVLVTSDPVTTDPVTLLIEVTPVAEVISDDPDGDTDGNNSPDLTMNGDHIFRSEGEEDEWFDLHSDLLVPGFDLKAPWSNEDGRGVENGGTAGKGSEETFARLTPYDVTNGSDIANGDFGTLLEGTYFQYVDGNGDTQTVPYNGTPVDIPIAFLDTLQVRGPSNFKGVLSIKVEAVTVDYDEDDGSATEPAVSGEAWLTNVILNPVADQVTLKVDARITANEDAGRLLVPGAAVPGKTDTGAPIALNINPTSDDPSETFNVTIKGIPAGSVIVHDGTFYDTAAPIPGLTQELDGSFTLVLENFDSDKQPALVPPLNSNQTINLSVEAVSIDTLTYTDKDGVEQTIISAPSAPHILPITITILGVPDEPVLVIDNGNVYVEDDLDTDAVNPHKVDLSDLITDLRSGETTGDGSETITLRISGLADGFSVEGAGPVVGNASGADRVWVVTPQQIADGTVFIKLPANYSGTVTFNAQPVVTENDNPSDTFYEPANISFLVTPSPEATLNDSSVMTEDTVSQVNLSPVYQNGDMDEVISAIRFEAVPGVQFFSDAAGITPLVATGGWYELTGAEVNSVYAKGPANFSGNITFDIEYKVTDTAADGTTGPVETGWQSTEHTLSFQAVTDPIELTLAAINGDTGVSSVTLTEAGNVTVSLNIAKQPDANAGGEIDYDTSERLTHILIQGVPDGVAVEGAQFTGAGQWLILLNTSLAENTFTGDITKNIVFQVNGSAGGIDNVPITITTFTQDSGSVLVEQDQITWNLTATFGPGEGTLPSVTLSEIDAPQTEDQEFALSQVVSGSFDTSPTDMASYNMTITLRTAPSDETSFSADGMTRTEVIENGQPVVLWTKTITGVTNATAEDALKNALDEIMVSAPEHANSNHGDSLGLDVTVTLHNAGVRSEGNLKPDVELRPVTDPASIGISAPTVDEGEPVAITINVSNPADQSAWQIIDGKLYLQLEGAGLPGKLMQGEQELSTEAVAGVPGLAAGDYYVIDGVQPGVDVLLSYVPDGEYAKGSVTLKAWVQNQEDDSVVVLLSDGQTVLTVQPTNTEPTLDISTSGTEHDGGATRAPTQLEMTGAVLPDADELLQSAFLEGLPKDFTVYYGASEGTAVLASNAGGSGSTNTWSIPISGNALPAYIGILPPAHWSGTLADLTLYIVSGEAGAEPTAWPIGFEFTIAPKADGLELEPTLSFGKAGDVITLNLNAAMKDQVAANGSDAHSERTTLELTGFPDGEKVAFYANGLELGADRVSFANGTYTITGLTQAELDNFGFLHGQTEGPQPISITAWTNEVNADGDIVGDDSDPATGSININVSAKLPTNGADTLLWTGEAIDGRSGDDTIQLRFGDQLTGDDLASNLKNIEVIDMVGRGASSITSLSVEDVFQMTDERNTLKILGDSQDSVNLGSGWSAQGENVYHGTFNNQQVVLEIGQNVVID